MPARISFRRAPPKPIQTQLMTPISASSGKDSFPSVGPGAYDYTVVPSHHSSRARTLVLCFDGTGDQFDVDVRTYLL
jgi:putative hemolysin